MDQCLANPSPSTILILEEESRDLGKLTSTVVSRRPKKNNADQLLCLHESKPSGKTIIIIIERHVRTFQTDCTYLVLNTGTIKRDFQSAS